MEDREASRRAGRQALARDLKESPQAIGIRAGIGRTGCAVELHVDDHQVARLGEVVAEPGRAQGDRGLARVGAGQQIGGGFAA